MSNYQISVHKFVRQMENTLHQFHRKICILQEVSIQPNLDGRLLPLLLELPQSCRPRCKGINNDQQPDQLNKYYSSNPVADITTQPTQNNKTEITYF